MPRRWWRPTGFVKPTSTDESPASAVGEAAVAADGGGAADAVHVQMVPHDPEQLACPLSDADAPDAEDDTRSVKSAITFLSHRTGDSVIGESEADLEEGEGEGLHQDLVARRVGLLETGHLTLEHGASCFLSTPQWLDLLWVTLVRIFFA